MTMLAEDASRPQRADSILVDPMRPRDGPERPRKCVSFSDVVQQRDISPEPRSECPIAVSDLTTVDGEFAFDSKICNPLHASWLHPS